MPAPRPTFTAEVKDSSGADPGLLDALRNSVLRAAAAWSQYLVGSASVDIDVEVGSSTIGTADGRSASSLNIGTGDGREIELSGTAEKIATGTDVNESTPDVIIHIDPGYISKYLWLDPDPGSDTLPFDKTNSDEVFEHELGHALGFNGYREGNSGQLGQHESTFDQNIAFDGSSASYTGASAEAIYGGPVPLTYSSDNPENFYHYANKSGSGTDLIDGLMSGVGHYLGTQASISQLDIAMLADAGCPIGISQQGTSEDDHIVAGNVPTVADLYQGDDTFQGGFGSDFVFGGQGDDRLLGRGGNDFLSGGLGINTLVGGDGADTFAVRVANATDRILDFHPGQGDSLRLAGQNYDFGTAADGSLMLNLSGGGSVTLEGIDPSRSGQISIVTRVL